VLTAARIAPAPRVRPARTTHLRAGRAPALAALQRRAGNRAVGRLLARQWEADPADDPRVHPAGAPKAKHCAIPSHCPSSFCEPYESESFARKQLIDMTPGLLLGIRLAVDARVVPLWRTYLGGGSAPRDLSADFGDDFAKSKTTANTTGFLVKALKAKLAASPPAFPAGEAFMTIPLSSLIASEIAEINKPGGKHEMNFNYPKEIAGNLAGGIGADETSCPAGAKPSPFNDERLAAGVVKLTKTPLGSSVWAQPEIEYTVKDTIDLCPGDCGTTREQLATVPLSQFEATGIAGDVPFTVKFSASPPGFFI
jgi:hypothetical protein